MVMVRESTGLLKGFLQNIALGDFWTAMAMRIVLAFICHRGRMRWPTFYVHGNT
jgi:hypothetical protein